VSNKFVFTGQSNGEALTVTYVPGITPGLSALTYQLGAVIKEFTQSHVNVVDTPIGELITVVIQSDLGAPAQDFSILLPALPQSNATLKFKTFGVYTTLRGPAIVEGFVPSYHVVNLAGTAEDAIIPLAR
jgi:hypothetical protein